jgi:glycosyltransferase involved in cell wall biosynthesis
VNATLIDIIIPTHDHALLLPHSIRSAREQTISDLRIVIVGDGVGDDTREVTRQAMADDHRIVFHDLPKAGGRTGEAHRNAIVGGSDARFVTYLCDDDLLFPDHVATMIDLLEHADLAMPPETRLAPDGSVSRSPWSLADDIGRARALDRIGLFSLTGLSHTMEAYRRLPFGWRETPDGLASDQFMIMQFLEQEWCRCALADATTTVHLPSHQRRHMSPEERGIEIDAVASRMFHGDGWAEHRHRAAEDLRLQALNYSLLSEAPPDAETDRLREELAATHQHARNLEAIIEELERRPRRWRR